MSRLQSFLDAMREADAVETAGFDAEKERQRAASFKAVKRSVPQATDACRRDRGSAAGNSGTGDRRYFEKHGERRDISGQCLRYHDKRRFDRTPAGEQGNRREYQKSHRDHRRMGRNSPVFLYVRHKVGCLTTDAKVLSEFTLCPADKSADAVDAVYYYTGAYTGIESMNSDDLQKIIADSKLLWKKQVKSRICKTTLCRLLGRGRFLDSQMRKSYITSCP